MSLREFTSELFLRLGFRQPDDAYLEKLEQMDAVAVDWFRSNPEKTVIFQMPDLLRGQLFTGALFLADEAGWCKNDEAREFVHYLDANTNREFSLLMLQVIMMWRQARQISARRKSGQPS